MSIVTREEVHQSRFLAGQVRRWHTWPTLNKPSVAEHQCRVTQIYCEIWGLPRAEVLYYCLHHDMGEQFAGDVPFGGKHRVDGYGDAVNEAEKLGLKQQGIELPEISEVEFQRFKIADILEMYEFSAYEFSMGNKFARVPMNDTVAVALDRAYKIFEVEKVQNWINGAVPWI